MNAKLGYFYDHAKDFYAAVCHLSLCNWKTVFTVGLYWPLVNYKLRSISDILYINFHASRFYLIEKYVVEVKFSDYS